MDPVSSGVACSTRKLKSSLRREQRRHPEALEASAAALKICPDLSDRRGILASHLLCWTGALLLQGLGRTEEAIQELEAVQTEFLDRRMPVDATLVSLDLAVALFESDRSEALKTLAAEILPIFETRGLTTEAVVAYTLLQTPRAPRGTASAPGASPGAVNSIPMARPVESKSITIPSHALARETTRRLPTASA